MNNTSLMARIGLTDTRAAKDMVAAQKKLEIKQTLELSN